MSKRIVAIGLIFLATAMAWAILGATVFYRTYSSDSELRSQVASLWGAPQEQSPPGAYYTVGSVHTALASDGKSQPQLVDDRKNIPLALEKSRIDATLNLENRKKGLLWYSTYTVDFSGAYDFRNPSDSAENVTFSLQFPTEKAIYDDVAFALDGSPLAFSNANTQAYGSALVEPHQIVTLHVGYRSQGLESWGYNFGGPVNQVKDFALRVTTDFSGFDFPENTLAPSQEQQTAKGWVLDWSYQHLVAGYKIGISLPEKLQPGPLTGRISFFAPVSLLFFFFILFVLTTLERIDLHPMNYFFLACAFFSFHLLMAYLVDHISINWAFLVCSAVSIFLVVSYLRLVAGMQRAAFLAGLAQLVYLVLFSYAFFFTGFTGLAIAIGAILTLFVVMQVTAPIRWSEQFAAKPASPAPGL